jgi:hypothetical protein
MEIQAAQREVRTVYLGGAVGQAVSGSIWLLSAIMGTWGSQRSAIFVLVVVAAFIFPLTQLVLRLMGRTGSLRKENPFTQLAMQTAFIIPLSLPVIAGAALYNINWFYPAFMIIVGVHYMPFMTLYGMWEFAVLAAALIFGGVAIAMLVPTSFVIGGWFTAVVLILFAVYAWVRYGGKSPQPKQAAY